MRQAIYDANANPGPDTIQFQQGLSGVISLNHGELAITEDLQIQGPGSEMLTIDAQQNSRVIVIDDLQPDNFVEVTLTGLRVTGGQAEPGEFGGGILNNENLSLNDSVVTGNTAEQGGGIANELGTLLITGSTLSNNAATGGRRGGGVYSHRGQVGFSDCTIADSVGSGIVSFYADVSVTDCSITNNVTSHLGGGIRVVLADLTVSESTITGNEGHSGGGISHSTGLDRLLYSVSLNIENSDISGNIANAGRGGGIDAWHPWMNSTITNSTISENSASSHGGGIYLGADATITKSTISDNSAWRGGGIFIQRSFHYSCEISVENSTLSGNVANEGAGIYAKEGSYGPGADLSLWNSTLSGNSATAGPGGGVRAVGQSSLNILFSTIAGNAAPFGLGGGVAIWDMSAEVQSSIIAGNQGTDVSGPGFASLGFNLIGTGDALTAFANNDLTGITDPMLVALQDNGGPTLTHALMPGSLAVDAGDPNALPGNGNTPLYDQRDGPFTRVLDGRIDIGSFEGTSTAAFLSLAATDSVASELGPDIGTFTIARFGDTSQPLDVSYMLSGTADSGVDYEHLSGSVTLLAGQATATVTVSPIDDELVEAAETVTMSLVATPSHPVRSPHFATITLDDDEAVDSHAQSENLIHGIRNGYVTNTHFSDNFYETLTEVSFQGGNRTSLEHQWVFDVTGGSSVTFFVEAYHDSELEAFAFEYSTDANNWSPMITVTKTADDNLPQTFDLPSSLSGTVYIRVIDTDNSRGDSVVESVYIDNMFVRSILDGGSPLPEVSIVATDAAAAEEGQDPGLFTVSRTGDNTNDLVVHYSVSGTADNGDDYNALSGTITIPGGNSSASIQVIPTDDVLAEGTEDVTLTLLVDPAYTLATTSADTVDIVDNDVVETDDYAQTESTVNGTVSSGSLTDTFSDDGVYEAIVEETFAGGKRSRLQHQWTFDVTGGSPVTFFVEAHHDSVAEDFQFEYSSDGSNWTPMLTVTKSLDDDSPQTFDLPASITGTLYVRVQDTDRSQNENSQDTIFVDKMFVRSGATGGQLRYWPPGSSFRNVEQTEVDSHYRKFGHDRMLDKTLSQRLWTPVITDPFESGESIEISLIESSASPFTRLDDQPMSRTAAQHQEDRLDNTQSRVDAVFASWDQSVSLIENDACSPCKREMPSPRSPVRPRYSLNYFTWGNSL